MIYDIELNSAAHYPVSGIVELSPLIEQAGFGAFWKGESNSTDPLILLSGIAARRSSSWGQPSIIFTAQSGHAGSQSPLCRTSRTKTAVEARRGQQDDRLWHGARSTARCAAPPK